HSELLSDTQRVNLKPCGSWLASDKAICIALETSELPDHLSHHRCDIHLLIPINHKHRTLRDMACERLPV
ncbi:hypothetical protein, partial [Pseudomonas sp. HMWF021]|uniref:hypothetical protein n=1 Tax=Pseudomonas sp. HMWF021 TaxID=2056857 RepID=UPI001C45866E